MRDADIATRRRLRLTNAGGLILLLGTAAWIPLQIAYRAWLLVWLFSAIVAFTLVVLVMFRRSGVVGPVSQVLALLLTLVIALGNWFGGGLVGANISMFVLIPVGAVTLSGRRGLWWIVPAVVVVVVMQWLHLQGYQFPNVIPESERATDSVLTWLTTAIVLAFLIYHYDSAFEQSARELESARRQAEEASLAKSRFVAHISHEIRTPLHGILGMVELMEDEPDPGRRQQLAEQAHRSADILLGVLGDILDLSRVEAGKLQLVPRVFHLRRDLEQVVELLGERARPHNTEVSFSLSPDVPQWLLGDSLRLRQVLLNLVSNAVKFTEAGQVLLSVSCLSRREQKVMLRFEVRDTGRGIDQEHLERIFEPFFQADGTVGGTGLGLAISRRLVELMGGRLQVESTPGRGSVFRFELTFQVAGEVEQRQVAEVAFPGEGSANPARVLLVEDNAVSRKLAVALLEKAGCRVVCAEDGQQAVEMVGREDFDLILMDLQMPNLDGLQATRRIRELLEERGAAAAAPGKRLPIVAVTAHALDRERLACIEAGMDDYLAKPFGRRELQEVLQRWLPGEAGKTGAT